MSKKRNMRYKKLIFALAKVQNEIEKFIKEIIMDSYNEPDNVYLKLGVDTVIYKIGIFNKKTGVTVVKNYDIENFMNMCANKKIEMELNIAIREMLIKSESNEKGVVNI